MRLRSNLETHLSLNIMKLGTVLKLK